MSKQALELLSEMLMLEFERSSDYMEGDVLIEHARLLDEIAQHNGIRTSPLFPSFVQAAKEDADAE